MSTALSTPALPCAALLPAAVAATPTRRPSASALTVLALVVGLGLAPTMSHAADAPSTSTATATDAAYAEAIAQFDRAAAGQDGAIAGAVAQWQALSMADPGNPVPRAYFGAATTMLARATLLPWRKMGHVDDGLALVDKALAQLTPAHEQQLYHGVPAALLVRFTAANTFNALPGLFNRGDRGARLMDEVLKSPQLDASPLGFRAAVWLRAGTDAAKAQRKDEARQWLEKVAASGAPQATEAQAKLKAL